MDVQRSCLVAAFMISYTLERAAAAAELAPREPGPGETNLIFVSREPGQLRALASREHGPGDGAGHPNNPKLHHGSLAHPKAGNQTG
jgi:hypothetical protein